MKKLLCIIHVMIVLIIVVTPIVCMNNDHDGRDIVFATSSAVISMKKSNVALIKSLDVVYQKNKKKADQGGVLFLPAYNIYTSDVALRLVDDVLSVRPDKFYEYYNKLSLKLKLRLINVAGQYNGLGEELTLGGVPELTKRLIDVYFTDRHLRQYIKSFLKDEDEDDVRNYFKERLISSKGLLTLKETIKQNIDDCLPNIIYPGSFFLNGYHTNIQCKYPVRAYCGKERYQMYGNRFITDTREHRVTEVDKARQDTAIPLGNQCLLWVMNHEKPEYTFSTLIEHKGDIKGCCLSKTGTDVDYVVTYSEHDIVFSTITTQDGFSYVNSVRVDTPNNGTIIDVCFTHNHGKPLVVTYEGLTSVLRTWHMDGKVKRDITYPFKKFGLFEKMFIGSDSSTEYILLIFGVAGMYSLHSLMRNEDGSYKGSYAGVKKFQQKDNYNIEHSSAHIIEMDDSIFMYDTSSSLFEKDVEASNKKWNESGSFVKNVMDGVVFKPKNSECYQVYSPDGIYMLCNTFKTKLGMYYIETAIKDAVTHKNIVSIDTLYKNFMGVGFARNGGELIFLNKGYANHDKVVLLNDEDKKMLSEIEDVAFDNLGITSLLKRLCMECKEKSIVTLYEDDPTYAMLIDWSRQSSTLLKFLQAYVPIKKLKVGMQKK